MNASFQWISCWISCCLFNSKSNFSDYIMLPNASATGCGDGDDCDDNHNPSETLIGDGPVIHILMIAWCC